MYSGVFKSSHIQKAIKMGIIYHFNSEILSVF